MNDAEENLSLTLEQEMKLINSPYAGTSSIEAKEELEEMRDLIKHSPPDDPARKRAERNLPKLEEYIDLYNRRAAYGVAQVIDLPQLQTISRAKLLTAHTVKPAAWELNLMAKMRMQKDLPSPYTKPVTNQPVYSPTLASAETSPITKAQYDYMCQHVCNGIKPLQLDEELKLHQSTVDTCDPQLPAWAWAKNRIDEIREYGSLYLAYVTYGKYLF